jgi:hypothetical protein
MHPDRLVVRANFMHTIMLDIAVVPKQRVPGQRSKRECDVLVRINFTTDVICYIA